MFSSAKMKIIMNVERWTEKISKIMIYHVELNIKMMITFAYGGHLYLQKIKFSIHPNILSKIGN